MKLNRNKRILLASLGILLVTILFTAAKSHLMASHPTPASEALTTDATRISNLIEEMEAMDNETLAALPAITVKPFVLPESGVDVMRVRLEETYDVNGIGKDTVPLTGWIAVKHFNTRPATGETEIHWGTAITDTEFVAMDLRGESKIFGPVQVRLDKSHPVLGRVGKLDLPFIVQVGLDAAYREHRRHGYPVGVTPNKSTDLLARKASSATQVQSNQLRGEKARVYKTLEAVMSAISNKDAQGMMRSYAKGPDTLFFGNFGTDPQRSQRDGDIELTRRAKMFDNIRSIKVTPDEDLRITVSGNTAVAALTGTNTVVNNKGERGSSPWRWTVELQKKRTRWMIVHDHLSFFEDSSAPRDAGTIRGLSSRADCCLASVSVEILMPNLDLKMITMTPVTWYSEVETIPPVGYTASVCLTPTPLISNGRIIATLESGTVNFREVVRHVALNGG
jgi:ketosteroid isomerase-like protein